jgi:broad specificity phosphatase PhoE
MSVIYVIRHAQASFGRENYDRLSDLGVKQAEILGDYLGHLGLEFDAVYSGTLDRQKDTAEVALGRMPGQARYDLRIETGLSEYDAEAVVTSQLPAMIEADPTLTRDVERMTERRPFQRVFEGAMLRWVSGRYDVNGVETWQAFSSRVRKAIGEIMAENGRRKKVVVFTSGVPHCATVQMAIGVTTEVAVRLNWQLKNTSVSEFKYNDKGIFLSSFNSVHHLWDRKEPELLTYR